MHVWALLAAPADARGLQKILNGMRRAAAGFEPGPNGEWFWSLRQRPIEGAIGVAEGPAVVLAKQMGMPYVRLRMAIPECMLPGHIAWSIGRGDAGLAIEALNASRAERDAKLKVLYTWTKDNKIQPMPDDDGDDESVATRRQSEAESGPPLAPSGRGGGGPGGHPVVSLPPVQEDAPYGSEPGMASHIIAHALRSQQSIGRSGTVSAAVAAAAAAAGPAGMLPRGSSGHGAFPPPAALPRGSSGHSAFGAGSAHDRGANRRAVYDPQQAPESPLSREDVFTASDGDDESSPMDTDSSRPLRPRDGLRTGSPRRSSLDSQQPPMRPSEGLQPARSLPPNILPGPEAETFRWFTNAAAEVDDDAGQVGGGGGGAGHAASGAMRQARGGCHLDASLLSITVVASLASPPQRILIFALTRAPFFVAVPAAGCPDVDTRQHQPARDGRLRHRGRRKR